MIPLPLCFSSKDASIVRHLILSSNELADYINNICHKMVPSIFSSQLAIDERNPLSYLRQLVVDDIAFVC